MFFQISPVVHKKSKPVVQKKPEQEEIEILSLEPFTENPKIVFENVAVGTTQKRKLIIKNPTSNEINLFIKTSISEELNFFLSWSEATIQKSGEELLEMTWTPIKEEASRQSFIISDGKRINRHIGVTFKAIDIQKDAGKYTKKSKTAVKLPLIRRPVSPIKKLRPLKNSPIRSNLKNKNSPSPQRKYPNREKEFNSQKPFSYENMRIHKENKENVSPVIHQHQETVHYKSVSFRSPNNNPFFTDINAYKFNTDSCERRDTYIVGQENIPKNAYLDVTHALLETKETIYLESRDNSPYFRDSLDSPNMKYLKERNGIQDNTPTLESLVSSKTRLRSGGNFEDRLKINTFTFSPGAGLTPRGEQSFKFAPEVFSTGSKPSSNNNSLENAKIITSLDFSKAHSFSAKYMNQSNATYTKDNPSAGDCSFETYLKSNVSGGTFVKENISGETFIKANLSGETYVKDSSVGNLAQLEVSPVSTRSFLVPSPKPRTFEVSPTNEHSRIGKKLSMITEESIIISERSSRSTTKRRSPIVSEFAPKREKLSSPTYYKGTSSAVRISTSSTGLNLTKYLNTSVKGQPQLLSSISETTTKTVIVKNPFLYANIIDPFMTSQIYADENWIEQQMHNFKKWLNALLTPPDELNTKTEIDVAKVWQECTKKEVSEAPSKEALSLKCHTNKKLNYVRKQAQQLFRSAEMSNVLQKVCLAIESGKLSIREDKDLHLNLKLKSDITRLILGYNPLWLRIGLETIYNEIIPMRSNSDTHALATFILERLLKDPHLMKKYKTVYAPKYTTDLKKFILKKFLILVYFLDRAKSQKLIQHDPCLFCKNAVDKESKLVLTHFARETLSAVGDITKYLKCLGYVVTHVQQYIHEFDYAVKNLGTDLRDGVRLTRVMEIIQMRNDLTMKLRVPAISRLQKVHNMQLVFKSLQDYGYEIQCDIVPKDIVDGHREKNLSFLWQIIYKFQAPLIVKSATTIQTWFRSLPVQLKRSQLRRTRKKRESAAKKIQLWYRRQKLAEIYFALGEFVDSYIDKKKQDLAAIKIQSFFRMWLCRRRFMVQYKAIIMIQTYAKGWLIRNYYRQRITACVIIQKVFRGFICRKRYITLKKNVILMQQRYRGNKTMKIEKTRYDSLKQHTLMVQRRFRAIKQMKLYRKQYLTMKRAAIQMQAFYKMYVARKEFIRLKNSTILVQRRYRAQLQMKSAHSYYLSLKQSVLVVQQRFRANRDMKVCRNQFILCKLAAIKLQSFYRMYQLRNRFVKLRTATLLIQTRFRALVSMRRDREYYLSLKNAAVTVQRRFRANVETAKARNEFVLKKTAAIKIQSYYRMYTNRKKFVNLLGAAKVIQQRYRAQKAMQQQYCYYRKLLSSVLYVQRKFRANYLEKQCRRHYLLKRHSAIIIQAHFKMVITRREFVKQKKAAISIQSWYRALVSMKKERNYYNSLKLAVKTIETRYQAQKMMQVQHLEYIRLKQATEIIQTRYRSLVKSRKAQKEYLAIKQATVTIQIRYRAILLAREERQYYKHLKIATTLIQQRFRANRAMRKARGDFLAKRNSATLIQRKYRAHKEMTVCRADYVALRRACIFVQSKYRAQKFMLQCLSQYRSIKKATVFIQRRFRANVLARRTRYQYVAIQKATLTIQRIYRAKHLMLVQRQQFLAIRSATIIIQQRYKAVTLMRKSRAAYLALKEATVVTQRKYRALVAMRQCKERFENLKKATIFIQRRYRANIASRSCRQNFLALRQAAIKIQRKFRGNVLRLKQMLEYSRMKWAATVLQRRYRAEKAMKEEMLKYTTLKSATFVIQRRWRATLLAKSQRKFYLAFLVSIVKIQKFYKSYLLAKKQREQFLQIRNAVLQIQRFSRGYLVRKKYASLLTPEAIEARRTRRVQSAAAVKIQALFRGYLLRKSKIPQMIALRTRLENQPVKQKATGEGVTLAERCDAAMDCIISEKSSLLMVISALEDIDFISRHSQNLCVQLSKILPVQLYLMINSAARSPPEMNAMNTATLILINFCKYPKTREYVWYKEYMDGLINVMLHWCDKEAPLFSTLCTLVWLFGHEAKWKKVLVSLPNIQQRFAKIQSLVNRKQGMVLKSKKVNLTSPFGPINGLKLPTKTANWGLDYDRPNIFTNAVFAFTNVMKILDL